MMLVILLYIDNHQDGRLTVNTVQNHALAQVN